MENCSRQEKTVVTLILYRLPGNDNLPRKVYTLESESERSFLEREKPLYGQKL